MALLGTLHGLCFTILGHAFHVYCSFHGIGVLVSTDSWFDGNVVLKSFPRPIDLCQFSVLLSHRPGEVQILSFIVPQDGDLDNYFFCRFHHDVMMQYTRLC